MFGPNFISWLNARLFGPTSSGYALGAIVGLITSLIVVFGPYAFPLWVVYTVMLVALLASSRVFSSRLQRYVWWLCAGSATISLVLCLVQV